MDILIPALNGVFVLIMTLVLTWYIRDRFSEQDKKILELRHDLDRRFAEFMADMDRRFADVDRRFSEFRTDMNAIRSELVNISLALGAQPRPDTA